MDASRTLNNRRGVAIVYLAIVLFVLVGFAALVIDLGYMYVNKAKLQNAADAAALAGAGSIKIPDLLANISARQAAKHYAFLNETSLSLNLNDGSNDEAGDIVLGVFEPTANPKFTAVPIQGTYSSINAVKVVARRNADTGTGIAISQKYDMFLGKIFGWDKMGTKASAIAFRPPRARTYLFLGYSAACKGPSNVDINALPSNDNMAWTSLSETDSANANDVKDLFCALTPPFIEACGKSIKTSNGLASSVFGAVMLDFYDPNYDRGQKTFGADGSVATWTVLVPYTQLGVNDPSANPKKWPVDGYAELVLNNACGSGGNICNPRPTVNAPRCNPSDNYFRYKRVKCVPCSNKYELIGANPVLCE